MLKSKISGNFIFDSFHVEKENLLIYKLKKYILFDYNSFYLFEININFDVNEINVLLLLR
jgi:hypothetical protein